MLKTNTILHTEALSSADRGGSVLPSAQDVQCERLKKQIDDLTLELHQSQSKYDALSKQQHTLTDLSDEARKKDRISCESLRDNHSNGD